MRLRFKTASILSDLKIFTLVMTNITRILQADPDLAMHNMQGTILIFFFN